MFEFLSRLDRRWVFLLMLLAVAVPLLMGIRFPEKPSPMVQQVFDALEELPVGSRVLIAADYDPAGRAELHPMAAAFTRHAAEKRHKIYFMALWPQGPMLTQSHIAVLENDYQYRYGRDYVHLGFRAGQEGVIKLIVNDLRQSYDRDINGTRLDDIPLTRDLDNIRDMDLIVSVSAGTPGTKEWVQYASTPYNIKTVSGSTGVQAPMLYPYIPQQLAGVLGGIKAAAEYEQILVTKYPRLDTNESAKDGLRRMGPQLVAHVLMILLIVVGNVIYFLQRQRGLAR
jgi:hypothetical protein